MSLGPRSLRPRVLAALARAAGGAPALLGLRGISRRLAEASAAKTAGACGGCDNCGSESAAVQPPPGQESSGGKSPPAEVRVPVANIGRRT